MWQIITCGHQYQFLKLTPLVTVWSSLPSNRSIMDNCTKMCLHRNCNRWRMYNYFSNIDRSYRMHSSGSLQYKYCESVLCVYTDLLLFLFLLFDCFQRRQGSHKDSSWCEILLKDCLLISPKLCVVTIQIWMTCKREVINTCHSRLI